MSLKIAFTFPSPFLYEKSTSQSCSRSIPPMDFLPLTTSSAWLVSLWPCHLVGTISHVITMTLYKKRSPNSLVWFPTRLLWFLPMRCLISPTKSFYPELAISLRFLWTSETRPPRCILLLSVAPIKRLSSLLSVITKWHIVFWIRPKATFLWARRQQPIHGREMPFAAPNR